MVAVTEQQESKPMELAQLEALERMLVEMCERLTEIVEETAEATRSSPERRGFSSRPSRSAEIERSSLSIASSTGR